MLQNLRYTLLAFVRNPALIFWPLAFPCVMAVLFNFMFANLDKSYSLQPVSLGVVRDAAYEDALGLDETLRAVGPEADDAGQHYLDITYFDDADAAARAVHAGEVAGYVTVDADGMPELHLLQSDLNEESRLHLSAVTAVLDGYVRVWHEVSVVARKRPELMLGGADLSQIAQFVDPLTQPISDEAVRALADEALASDGSAVIERFTTDAISTERLRLTRSDPDASARYFYALLGMAAGLGAALALTAVRALQANHDALGARRTMAGLPRWRLLVSSLAAAWIAEMACLVAGFLFMRLVIGVNFGTRTPPCLLAMAASSFAFCGLGALAGTFARMPETLITALTALLAFFAGLYGTASQRVADGVAAAFPPLGYLNPVRTTSQAFYALLYHDSLVAFARHCAVLVALGVASVSLAALRMRRMRHAHL